MLFALRNCQPIVELEIEIPLLAFEQLFILGLVGSQPWFKRNGIILSPFV